MPVQRKRTVFTASGFKVVCSVRSDVGNAYPTETNVPWYGYAATEWDYNSFYAALVNRKLDLVQQTSRVC